MSAEFFLDTNVVAYAFDASAPLKRSRARELMSKPNWVVSWQVIQEFSHLALHKFASRMTPSEICRACPVAALRGRSRPRDLSVRHNAAFADPVSVLRLPHRVRGARQRCIRIVVRGSPGRSHHRWADPPESVLSPRPRHWSLADWLAKTSAGPEGR